MDLHSIASSLLTNSTPIILLLFFLYKVCDSLTRSHKKKIPGPWKLPLIGSMHHLNGSVPPHQAVRDLARIFGPIMHLQLGEMSTVFISSAVLAKEVLKTHDLVFSDRQNTLAVKIFYYNGKDIAFSPHGEYWKKMRKICTVELLSNKKVKSFASIREEEGKKLVEYVRSCAGSPINLSKKIFAYSNAVVCRATFGNTSEAQHEAMVPLFAEIMHLFGIFDVSDLFPSLKFLHGLGTLRPKVEKIRHELDVILDGIINERREILVNTKRDNGVVDEKYLLDMLLRIEDNGGFDFPITSIHIKSIIADMIVGGTDTTSIAIDWTMAELVRNPRVMHKAQAELREALKGKITIGEADIEELSYLKLVVKEALRLHTPAPLLAPRICKEDCEIGGYIIPVNSKVVINAWALSRDPEYWNDPETFEPERFENSGIDFSGNHFEYLPFGTGRRVCAGTNFGVAGILLPVAQLLYHFNWELPDGMNPEEVDMAEAPGFANARKNNLILVATSPNN